MYRNMVKNYFVEYSNLSKIKIITQSIIICKTKIHKILNSAVYKVI